MDDIEKLKADLQFCLRDWNGKDRFHSFDVSALLVNKAAQKITDLQAEVAGLKEALEAMLDAPWSSSPDATIKAEKLARKALGAKE